MARCCDQAGVASLISCLEQPLFWGGGRAWFGTMPFPWPLLLLSSYHVPLCTGAQGSPLHALGRSQSRLQPISPQLQPPGSNQPTGPAHPQRKESRLLQFQVLKFWWRAPSLSHQ